MASNERYIRKFIILNNYANYFNEENKRVKGYGKIEIREGKGKIFLNVEGFKHHYKNKVYKLYLLSKSDKGLIEVDTGPIRIRDDGKGQLEWKFNPQDLGDTGLPMEKFDTIMIRLCNVGKELEEELIVPLAGFIDKKNGDILDIVNELKINNGLNKSNKNQDNTFDLNKPYELSKEILDGEEEINNKEEESETKLSLNGYEDFKLDVEAEEVKEAEEINEEKPIEKEETEIIEEQNSDEENEEEPKEEQQDQDEELESEEYEEQETEQKVHSKAACKECKDTTYYNQFSNNTRYYGENINQYNNQVVNYALSILKFFEQIEPLKENLEDHMWWEIEYDRRNIYRGFLPYYNYVINVYQQYPFITRNATCQGLIKKYRHYIFGIAKNKGEIKYYIYGVPGKFTRGEHPYNGLTGFTTWYESSNSRNDKNGYWLLYIDAMSGKIVTPLNPMMPH